VSGRNPEKANRQAVERERRRRIAAAFGEPLPDSTRDEREGWGEHPRGGDDPGHDQWFKDQVPPHHG
jgi:hypothetical protein